MKLKIGAKILLIIVTMCMLLVVLIIPLIYTYSAKYTGSVVASNLEISELVKNNITHEFEENAIEGLEMIARSVATSISHHIEGKNLSEILDSEDFKKIAIKNFYKSGYTIILDPKTYLIVSHPRKDFSGKYIYDTSNYNELVHKQLVEAINLSQTQDGVLVKYKYLSESGDYKDKISYIVQIKDKTKDGVMLVAMATMYSSDFLSRVDEVKSLLNQKNNESVSFADMQAGWFINIITLGVFLTFLASLALGIMFSKRLSKNIVYLTEACKIIAGGNFESNIKKIDSKDELETLSISIENMRVGLSNQSETIKKQAEKERERVKELAEALEIAEEKTKKLIDQAKQAHK